MLEYVQNCFKRMSYAVAEDLEPRSGPKQLSSHYIRVYRERDLKDKVFDYFAMKCCTPDFLMKRLIMDRPISVIITSGTLSPLDSLESELGIAIQYKKVFPHVISKEQSAAYILMKGPLNTDLWYNYQNRETDGAIRNAG